MDRLKMHTPDLAEENFKKLAELFPNAVTEKKNENGEVVRAIDADVLRQEISAAVVEGPQERYQFTWPDKKKAIILSNTPIAKTLRLDREKSVGRDGTPGGIDTENIYIEGDNLDALKLLQETYLGKVKMIYIDPPYNTGDKDNFVYMDDFSQERGEYLGNSGQLDEVGNRLVANLESNGRFHTDWLNMIYPRLKLAKDLLADNGVIFISIDENEQENLRKVCDEVLGSLNYRNTIIVRRRVKSLNSQFAANGLYSMNVGFEYVLVYSKSPQFFMKALYAQKENASSVGRWDVFWSNADRPTMRYEILGFCPRTGQWRNSKEKADIAVANYIKYTEEFANSMTLEEYYYKTGISEFIRRIPNGRGKNGGVQHWIPPSNSMLRTSNWLDIEVSQISKEFDIPFNNPKNKKLLIELIRLADVKCGDYVLDFFSGSATTAHAVMQLNAEDGGNRKFIMVQIPEACDEKKEAYKAGYRNVCEIGEERIRRAGKKIKEETGADIDYGFRVFRVDSSNMEDVYYRPDQYVDENGQRRLIAENIKPDRRPEDLLIQVMLDMGVSLSSDIEESEIGGKRVFSVAGGYLIACFDSDVTEETVKAIAQMRPCCAVFRDSGMAGDSVIANFEQIFETYSPKTQRKVL